MVNDPFRALAHLPGALNVVAEDSDEQVSALLPDMAAAIVTYSPDEHCNRGPELAARLRDLGYRDVRTEDWIAAGLPVEPARTEQRDEAAVKDPLRASRIVAFVRPHPKGASGAHCSGRWCSQGPSRRDRPGSGAAIARTDGPRGGFPLSRCAVSAIRHGRYAATPVGFERHFARMGDRARARAHGLGVAGHTRDRPRRPRIGADG